MLGSSGMRSQKLGSSTPCLRQDDRSGRTGRSSHTCGMTAVIPQVTWAGLGPALGRLWADLWPTFGRLVANLWLTFGRLLADFWLTLGRLWDPVWGALWAGLGSLLADFGPSLDRLWANLGPTLGRHHPTGLAPSSYTCRMMPRSVG